MGKKAFSTKQKREQLRAKRAAANDGGAASSATKNSTSRRNSATKQTGRPRVAEKPTTTTRDHERYRLELGAGPKNRIQDREFAHIPVVGGDDPSLTTMDVHAVRPPGFSPVPRRPAWSYEDSVADVDRREEIALNRWKRTINNDCYYERNLETWRQLWRVVERSDVLVLVVDVRYPALHFVPDLYHYVKELPGKEMLIALNKCDLVSHEVREAWSMYFEHEFPHLKVVTFSSFPDAKLAPCDANSEILSKRERRMARIKLAAWGADRLAEAVAALPLTAEKQGYLAAWRDSVRAASNGDGLDEANFNIDDETDDPNFNQSRTASTRSFSPMSDDVMDNRELPELNKERARGKKASRKKRRRTKPNLAAIAAASRVNDVDDDVDDDNEPPELPVTPPADEVSIVSGDDDWNREDMITIGVVGHPNTGKSSMINGIFRKKVVSTSRTPGHTKHLQTMNLTEHVRLCDCPGLVFPAKASKSLQTLAGMFPIAQLSQPYAVVKYLADRVPLPKILGVDDVSNRAKLREAKGVDEDEPWTAWSICEAWALKRGFRTAKAARLDVFRAANSILRLAHEGRIVLYTVPPGFMEMNEENEAKVVDAHDSMMQETWKRTKMNAQDEGALEAVADAVDEESDSESTSEGQEDEAIVGDGGRRNTFMMLESEEMGVGSGQSSSDEV